MSRTVAAHDQRDYGDQSAHDESTDKQGGRKDQDRRGHLLTGDALRPRRLA